MSHFWHLEYWGGLLIVGILCTPALYCTQSIVHPCPVLYTVYCWPTKIDSGHWMAPSPNPLLCSYFMTTLLLTKNNTLYYPSFTTKFRASRRLEVPSQQEHFRSPQWVQDINIKFSSKWSVLRQFYDECKMYLCRFRYYGMWQYVLGWVVTDVSKPYQPRSVTLKKSWVPSNNAVRTPNSTFCYAFSSSTWKETISTD